MTRYTLKQLLAAFVLVGLGCKLGVIFFAPRPEPILGGYKMSHVEAICFPSERAGYVRFTFPQNPNDCDRAELVEFMEKHGGIVWTVGGYPGAPIRVVFKDAQDKSESEANLLRILPALNDLVKGFKGA